jgi:hypothetical protein
MTYLLRLGKLKFEFTSLVLNVPKQDFEFVNAVTALNAFLQFANKRLGLLDLNFQPFCIAFIKL